MSRGIQVAHAIPDDWIARLKPGGILGLGLDLGTTTKGKSNPTALALTEKVAMTYYVRLLMRWKTANPDVTRAVIRRVLDMLKAVNRRGRRLCIDATNERFWATDLRAALVADVPVDLVISSETTLYLGEPMTLKAYLGNLYINTLEDNQLVLPPDEWVRKDARQVRRAGGTFEADVEEDGSHADGFDATKLSLHALVSQGGPAHAEAVPVGSEMYGARERAGIRNPFARRTNQRRLLPV